MAVILNLVSIDLTTPYNCEVCYVRVCLICDYALTDYDPKIEFIFQIVSTSIIQGESQDLTNECLPVVYFFLQTAGYLAFSAAALLIVFRMYVLLYV
jgi:hypothetical protein